MILIKQMIFVSLSLILLIKQMTFVTLSSILFDETDDICDSLSDSLD